MTITYEHFSFESNSLRSYIYSPKQLPALIVTACNDLEPEMIVRAFTAMISRTRKNIESDENAFFGE